MGPLTSSASSAVLRSAVLAPSIYNTQPWLFRCTTGEVEVHGDFRRALPVTDGENRELALSCGAALFNLRTAIHHRGFLPISTVRPRPGHPSLFAAVRPVPTAAPHRSVSRLAEAIPRRRTARGAVTACAVPDAVIAELRHAAEAEQSWLVVFAERQRAEVVALIARACRAQLADPQFRAERSRWSGRGRTSDGLPASGEFRRPAALTRAGHEVPLLVLIASFDDGPVAWLHAGQALQRVLLTATLAGLDAGFWSAPVEVGSARRELRALSGGAVWPQALLALGRGRAATPSARRDLAEVLIE
ncbi:hypothetical protein [Amycolatopsis sp. Hca4]|uniref:Acg family FMN-binding oxidoreductase n=1 Tax=Amycolatopsis sp. Hca4 TaxID=2742131 RepID=UPI0020CB2F7B|nr:hypothetical protein [Amycolatopsis sp. Hca4]